MDKKSGARASLRERWLPAIEVGRGIITMSAAVPIYLAVSAGIWTIILLPPF